MSTSHPKSAIFAEYVQRPTPEERKLDVSPEVENVMKAMAKTLAEAMGGYGALREWELATRYMKTEIERKEERLNALVLRPNTYANYLYNASLKNRKPILKV